MAAALYLPPTRRLRLRFTIGGLLAWTLIISVGLARWRLPGATLLGACLASLTAWLTARLASSLVAAWYGARPFRQMPREARWSLALDIGSSLAGMVVCLFVIGSGFANWKPAALTTANELLGCFGAWLAVGVFSRAAHGVGQLVVSPMPRSARWGLAVEVAARLGMAVLIVAAGCVAITRGIDLPRDWYESHGASVLGFTAFFLAVVCAYWSPRSPTPDESAGQQLRRRAMEGALLTVGTVWAAIVLLNPGGLTAFLRILLQEVDDFQPTRWNMHDLHPATLVTGVSVRYSVGSFVAAGLLLGSTMASLLMLRWWQYRRTRYTFIALSLSCLAAVLCLVGWYRFELLPEYSPLLAAGVAEQRLDVFPLAALLAAAVSTVFAWWYAVAPQPDGVALGSVALPAKQFFHEHPAVIAVGLLGAVAVIAGDVSQHHWGWWGWTAIYSYPLYGSLTDYLLEQPFKLIVVAAALVLGQRLWGWWRGATGSNEPIRQVEPGRFAAAWLAAMATLVLLTPVAAWCGSAILLKFLLAL